MRSKPSSFQAELANSITHGLGVVLSVAALVAMVVMAARQGDGGQVVACSIFGATLVLLYLASTLYHSTPHPPTKRMFRIVDHASIYFLIAGTYTPFAFAALDGWLRWTLISVLWGLVALGVAFKTVYTGRFRIVSSGIYLVMGWMALLLIKPLLAAVSWGGVLWMAAGGLCYTLGVVFYSVKSIPHHHAIWHVFVMAGSACHVVAVMAFILS